MDGFLVWNGRVADCRRPGPAADLSRLDQTAPDRVTGQVDAVAHAEPVQDVGAVALDGLDAEHEQLGDLLRADIDLSDLEVRRPTLEDVYLELTRERKDG